MGLSLTRLAEVLSLPLWVLLLPVPKLSKSEVQGVEGGVEGQPICTVLEPCLVLGHHHGGECPQGDSSISAPWERDMDPMAEFQANDLAVHEGWFCLLTSRVPTG